MERLVRLARSGSSATAVVLLVAFNMLPLVGVLLWGWNIYSLLILYWLENGIVGLFAVLRIIRAAGPIEAPGVTIKWTGADSASKAVIVPFFLMHYGIFWLVHGIFVFTLPLFMGIGGGMPDVGAGALELPVIGPDGFPAFPGDTSERGLEANAPLLRADAIVLGGIGLAISHGVSFWLNYLGRGEYLRTSGPAEAMAPYGRVVILHLTIILGAIVSLTLGSPFGSVVVLVVLKTVVDLALHLRSHGEPDTPRSALFAGS